MAEVTETEIEVVPFDWADCNARIETLILIPAATSQGEGGYPDAFKEEFCENLPERADAPLYRQLPQLARFAEGEDWPEAEEVAEALYFARANGFLINAAQPVVTQFYDSGSFSYSWGYYHTEWLYAATAEDIERVVQEWSVATLQADRQEAAKKAAEVTHA